MAEKKFTLNERTNTRQLVSLGIYDFKAGWDGFVELDAGKAKVNLNYDSLDEAKSGGFKNAVLFQLENSKTWKIAKVALADARFGGRCNGSDFRIDFPKEGALLINAVAVIQNKGAP